MLGYSATKDRCTLCQYQVVLVMSLHSGLAEVCFLGSESYHKYTSHA